MDLLSGRGFTRPTDAHRNSKLAHVTEFGVFFAVFTWVAVRATAAMAMASYYTERFAGSYAA